MELRFGFETPITSFTFVDLKPATEYEMQVRTRNAVGNEPACLAIRIATSILRIFGTFRVIIYADQ